MNQVTIYLDPYLAENMQAAAQREGVSPSKWLADLIKQRLESRWPEAVRRLAGAWAEFPEAEALRAGQGEDLPRDDC